MDGGTGPPQTFQRLTLCLWALCDAASCNHSVWRQPGSGQYEVSFRCTVCFSGVGGRGRGGGGRGDGLARARAGAGAADGWPDVTVRLSGGGVTAGRMLPHRQYPVLCSSNRTRALLYQCCVPAEYRVMWLQQSGGVPATVALTTQRACSETWLTREFSSA